MKFNRETHRVVSTRKYNAEVPWSSKLCHMWNPLYSNELLGL